MFVVTVTKGPDQGKQLPMQPGKRYTVGSGDESLALTDPRVLSPHCSLQTDTSGRVLLTNETASAGTFVGDKKIAKALIRPGVTFRVGDTLLTLQRVAERPAPQSRPHANSPDSVTWSSHSRRYPRTRAGRMVDSHAATGA